MRTAPFTRPLLGLGLVALAALIAPPGVAAQACLPFTSQTGNELIQEFPPNGPMQTAWKVSFGFANRKGLFITNAEFKRSPSDPYMKVLSEAGMADIFVPYHPGSPRFLDLSQFNFALVPVAPVDLGQCGQTAASVVIKEVRDRGLLWKDDSKGKRGYELVIWATLDAANYNYIMSYHFRDDGSIGFRTGATARNLPGAEQVAHMHDGLWRIDIDLNGKANDVVTVHSHNESIAGPAASDTQVAFNANKEGFLDWTPGQFTMLNIADPALVNGQGKTVSYDLMAERTGTPRHQESYAQHDFWVTRYKVAETAYTQVASYVAAPEAINNQDVVIWYMSPAHHQPRSEDGRVESGVWRGSAILMWSGFDLRPRNLFDTTPHFP
jgi:Cu2+-containing amine oxidase